jgi:hypothetical protein
MPAMNNPASQDRRSFLGFFGKTLALGLGIGAFTSGNSSASSSACEIYCIKQSCSDFCNGVLCSGTCCFHCTGCDQDFYTCSSHTSNYCFSNVCP